jgi:DNA-binding winged helix-turn-helix (wHTH) protein
MVPLVLNSSHTVTLGDLSLSPRERRLDGPGGRVTVEPLVMRALLALLQRAGRMTTRDRLFEACWGKTPVGDDSLNRIIAALRKALRGAGCSAVEIETVPATGYILRLALPGAVANPAIEVAEALRGARQSWRNALPVPDCLAIATLVRGATLVPGAADVWGALALLNRHAAEYAPEVERADYVAQCHEAAERALALDPEQPEASVSQVSLAPLFGFWAEAHDRLSAIHARHPSNVVAAHDLSIIEMSTGRVAAAKALIDPLIAADPTAAIYGYKSTYHHWSIGDLATMDRCADRALQLWPTHPALWIARYWTLAYTGRPVAAARMLADDAALPPLPHNTLEFMRRLMRELHRSSPQLDELAEEAARAAGSGQVHAITSLFALGLIGDAPRAEKVLQGYYLHAGPAPVSITSGSEAPVNEMRRRVTQILFTPAGTLLRSRPAFGELCDRIGLSDYWSSTGRRPDFTA